MSTYLEAKSGWGKTRPALVSLGHCFPFHSLSFAFLLLVQIQTHYLYNIRRLVFRFMFSQFALTFFLIVVLYPLLVSSLPLLTVCFGTFFGGRDGLECVEAARPSADCEVGPPTSSWAVHFRASPQRTLLTVFSRVMRRASARCGTECGHTITLFQA
jgi:hypothetical protein